MIKAVSKFDNYLKKSKVKFGLFGLIETEGAQDFT